MALFSSVLGKVNRQLDAPNIPGLGRGGSLGLRDILTKYFLPEFERLKSRRGGIEDAFLQQASTPGSLYGAASEAASGTARQLFAPGGEVQKLIGGARGRAIGQGFAPDAAEGAERGILQSATNRVADTFATQAAGLEQARFAGFAGFTSDQSAALRDLIESIFTGTASAEQLGLAKKAQRSKFLGIF